MYTIEKDDAKLCDDFSQASLTAGEMQGLEPGRRTRLEFDGVPVFRIASAWNSPRWVVLI